MKTVFVLNGPNLNLLGLREPAIYGAHTLQDVQQLCEGAAARNQLALRFHQQLMLRLPGLPGLPTLHREPAAEQLGLL